MNWSLVRCLLCTGLMAVLPWTFSTAAQAYDTELQALAGKLSSQLETAGQKSGTVLDFTDLQGSTNELGRFLAQELSNQLVSTSKHMSFVDRANLQTLMRENKLSVDGLVNPESSKKLGNLIGIDTMIFGTTTMMGDTVRLSVRAVAVETGKIVASQSTTLPANSGLAALGPVGVPSASPPYAAAPAKTADPRERLRGDSIRLTGKEILVTDAQFCDYNPGETCLIATLVLENLSGIGFDAGIASGSTSIAGCISYRGGVSGLSVMTTDSNPHPNPYSQKPEWRFVPVGAKLNLAINVVPCDPQTSALKTADVAASLAVKIGEQKFSLPISASNVPVRVGKRR